jgi:hypothetical protein
MRKVLFAMLAAGAAGFYGGCQLGKESARLPPGTQLILPHGGIIPPGVVLPPAHFVPPPEDRVPQPSRRDTPPPPAPEYVPQPSRRDTPPPPSRTPVPSR